MKGLIILTLTGEYTQAGAVISAQVLAGSLALQITRAAAGTGRTEPSQTHLDDERQPLALSGGTLDGSTYTIPAKLNSTEAGGAFMMSEIGLYAKDAADAEILYKIYRFDQPVSISPQCQLIATFYLNDTVMTGSGATVTVSPSGLMTAQDVEDMFSGLPVLSSTTTQINCTPANLQQTIDALPRIINNHITVAVSAGTISGNLVIQNFAGVGTLTIAGQSASPLVITGYLDVFNCRLMHVSVQNMAVNGNALRPTAVREYGSAAVSVRDCSLALLEGINVAEPAESIGAGFFIQRSRCVLGNVSCPGRACGILGHMHSHIGIRSLSGSGTQRCTRFTIVDLSCIIQLPVASASMNSYFGSTSYQAVAASTMIYGTNSYTGTGIAESNQ